MGTSSHLGRLGWIVAAGAVLTLGACASEDTCNSPGGPSAHCSQATGTGGGSAGSGNAGTGTSTAGTGPTSGSAGASGNAGSSMTTGMAGAAGTGSGGTTSGAAGAAGAGGASGATGTAGSGTGGSGAGGGLAHAMPSAGCGTDAGQALMSYVKYMEMVPGATTKQAPRNYYVWLPNNYNNKRAYPTVFIGPGCGSNGTMGIQIQVASGEDAIVIGLDPSTNVDPEGRQCFDSQSNPNPEIPYFDETLKNVEAKFCVDKSRLFIGGFSSGSWTANLFGCARGNVLRAQGNASGCQQGNAPTCTGPFPAILTDDMGDNTNSFNGCGIPNRDRMIKLNGCTTVTEPYDPGIPASFTSTCPKATKSCVIYKNCTSGMPVVWCVTTTLGHNDQQCTGLSTYGFWNFWSSLP
jgi:poly(3-hydroxybutyrate) depolymerase